MDSRARIGFTYRFQCFGVDGKLKWTDIVHNLIPDQGRDYILNASLFAGSQFTDWYIGLYSGAYTPQTTDVMATFAATSTEVTAYTSSTRKLVVPDALDGGVYINSEDPAIFTFNDSITVRGGFISSNGVKSGTTGLLLSAVLGSSPKPMLAGEELRVIAGLSLTTV